MPVCGVNAQLAIFSARLFKAYHPFLYICSMKWTAFLFFMLVTSLVIQTAEAHVDFWSSEECVGHVCCSDSDKDADLPLSSSESGDENSLCHPFDACHSCLHITPDIFVLYSLKVYSLFPSPVWSTSIPDRDLFPYEGPPPK